MAREHRLPPSAASLSASHIEGHQAVRIARDLDSKVFEHGLGTTQNKRDQACCGPLVQSLPQALGRGDAADAQGLLEIVIVPHTGNGLGIALAQAQQPQVAA